MILFGVAHALQLRDGSHAIRCPDFPGCEARHGDVRIAREWFGEVLLEHAVAMLEGSELPPLYNFAELEPVFRARCVRQIDASDRQPGTYDTVITVQVRLPAEAAARYAVLHALPPAARPVPEVRRVETTSIMAEASPPLAAADPLPEERGETAPAPVTMMDASPPADPAPATNVRAAGSRPPLPASGSLPRMTKQELMQKVKLLDPSARLAMVARCFAPGRESAAAAAE